MSEDVLAKVNESRKSFPSGHASLIFQAATFVILYLQLKLSGNVEAIFPMQLLSFLVALVVSVTRITDNKHHGSDVVAGALLGIAVQAFNIGINFERRATAQTGGYSTV